MKILIVIDSLGSGGAERSTEVLCDYLTENNVSFHILALDKKKVGVQEKMINKGYSISFIKNTGFAGEVQQIVQVIRRNNYGLVHSILFRSNIRVRFAKLKVKFLHLESLVNTTYSGERKLDKQVNQFGLYLYKILDRVTAKRGVDHFHSITETVKKHYTEEVGIKPSKITVVPRGRKPMIESYEERPSSSHRLLSIVNVGRHEFQKGQIYLLQAAKILKDKQYRFSLKIFGREGTVTPDLKKFIKENKLENFVSLEGYSSTIPQHLLNADVFAFSSLYEGLGGALIEAQAAGLPIACNNIPVLHEVVRENCNAQFFNVFNTNSIVKALEFYINNPDERISFGKKSLKNYQEKFQESKNNQKLLCLYKKLIDEKS